MRISKAFVLVLILFPYLFFAQTQTQNATEYVCPPCGCSNDGKVFNAPGSCPVCGMSLVPKQQKHEQEESMKAAILIFDGVQIIDFTGPYEVLGQAGIEAFTVAENANPLRTTMGMTVTPAYTFENAPPAQLLIVPGGDVHTENKNITQWIQQRAKTADYVLSVCNGAFYLAEAGLLDGREATTFYNLIDDLQATYPKVHVVTNKRYVDNGKVITSAGLSSGIDGTLYLVSKMYGHGTAQQVALNMEYDWHPGSTYARANFADKYLRRMMSRRLQIQIPNQVEAKVVNTQGTTDQWETQWEVQANSSLKEVQTYLEGKLQEAGKWSRDGSGWKFTGDNGEKWAGSLNVATIEGKQNSYLINVKIHKI
jgi:transcriptional regulator GlxA family with amidase domain